LPLETITLDALGATLVTDVSLEKTADRFPIGARQCLGGCTGNAEIAV